VALFCRKHIWILCALLLVAAFASSAHALSIQSVRFASHKNQMRLSISLNNSSDFRAFVLSDPYRMIIDLPQFEWRAGSIEKQSVSGILDVRQGVLADGVSRIVFDLARPTLISSAYIDNHNTLIVDFTPAEHAAFSQKKNDIYGNLRVNDPAQQPIKDVIKRLAKQKMPEGETHTKILASAAVQPPPTPAAKKQMTPAPSEARDKPLIVIDPGHGGVDPGAVGASNQKEKNVTLALARDLRDALMASGLYRVEMTRDKDVFIPLRERVAFAREKQADLFVSIHADSIHRPDVSGTSVYTLSKEASDAQTAKLAEKENQVDLIGGIDLSVEDEQVAFILGDFLITETLNQSKFFANTLVSELEDHNVSTLDNTHRYAGFAVLKAPDIPSVLVEAGFMSNKKEAELLSQKEHRNKISQSLKASVDSYFKHVRQAQLGN
jgi:N-acetylmuramoyl-L-alanine amidase